MVAAGLNPLSRGGAWIQENTWHSSNTPVRDGHSSFSGVRTDIQAFLVSAFFLMGAWSRGTSDQPPRNHLNYLEFIRDFLPGAPPIRRGVVRPRENPAGTAIQLEKAGRSDPVPMRGVACGWPPRSPARAGPIRLPRQATRRWDYR
jgi:hypothetical protein